MIFIDTVKNASDYHHIYLFPYFPGLIGRYCWESPTSVSEVSLICQAVLTQWVLSYQGPGPVPLVQTTHRNLLVLIGLSAVPGKEPHKNEDSGFQRGARGH